MDLCIKSFLPIFTCRAGDAVDGHAVVAKFWAHVAAGEYTSRSSSLQRVTRQHPALVDDSQLQQSVAQAGLQCWVDYIRRM